MLESYKITATTLKRYLKIHVNLPSSYRDSDKKYPLILSFDGEYYFNFIKENTKICDIDSIINNYEVIYIAIQSPQNPLWKESELNPYYNGKEKQVDKVLAVIFAEYIINELIPMFKTRYRISDEIYLVGYNRSSILALYMVNKYKNISGFASFNFDFKDTNDTLFQDLDTHYDKTKLVYLYKGERKSNYDDKFYELYLRFRKYEYEYIMLDYTDEVNDINSIKNHLKTFLDFVTEK